MIGAVSGVGYMSVDPCAMYYAGLSGAARPVSSAQSAEAASAVQIRSIPAARTGTPVQPVDAAGAVAPAAGNGEIDRADLLLRYDTDPAAMAVRGRIQYPEQARQDAQIELPGAEEEPVSLRLPGQQDAGGVRGAQEAAEEGECQTCKERKYQDGSDDPGVSFKTPTHIDPDMAASAVRGHENEHVVRNQAEADREGREVVSQTVTYHTAICPECGRVYVSGGTTRTVTADGREEDVPTDAAQNENADRTRYAA